MVFFVGAGPGDPDLITLRGQTLVRQADVIIYAGSLVNPALLKDAKSGCAIYDSAAMTLPGVLKVMKEAEKGGKSTVRLHTGDSSIYGAVREQMDALQGEGIPFEVVPGVSSFCGAAAAMKAEYTLPGVSQTVIITRKAGRTPVPGEESVAKLAAHGATMVIFLSAGMTKELQEELLAGGYPADTPAAIVYKATWPDEKIFYCTIGNLHQTAQENGIRKTALITVGGFLGGRYKKSRLYDASFTHEYRKGSR